MCSMVPAMVQPSLQDSSVSGLGWEAAPAHDESLEDEVLGYFDSHFFSQNQGTNKHQRQFCPLSADQACNSEQFDVIHGDASILQPHLLWNPTPTPPEFLRDELTSSLANVAKINDLEPSNRPAVAAYHEACPQQVSADSNADHGDFAYSDKIAHVSPSSGREQSYSALYERKLETNRQAQKRFRARRKDRTQATEHQLAETTAELHRLKNLQQELETRNVLLEKVSQINKQQGETQTSATGDLSLCDQPVIYYETSMTDAGRGVTITLPGYQQSITIQEISQLNLDTFAAVWTEYVRELGALLVVLSEAEDASAQARMEHLTIESTQLLGCIKTLNPSLFKDVRQGRLDAGHTLHAQQLDLSWILSLPRILGFNEDQMQDFYYMRRLYLTRRAVLAQQRNTLIAQMNVSSGHLPDPSDSLNDATDFAAKLRQNAVEDYEVYVKVSCAVRRGVFSTKQWATMIMHAYPFFPGVEQCLEGLTVGTSQASLQEICAGAQHNPMTAEWQALDDYLSVITQAHAHDYEPTLRSSKSVLQAQRSKWGAQTVSLHDMLM